MQMQEKPKGTFFVRVVIEKVGQRWGDG